MTPRNEHWRAFDTDWFTEHQRILLWLLNAPLIGRWFKWCLCIRACDIGHRRMILELRPHCYTVAGEQPDTLTTDFRTHWKYAKRLYYAFRPLWWAMHWWDSLADAWCPQFSFELSTLTAYPDPDPETNTVDGHIAFLESSPGVSWASLLASSNVSANDTLATIVISIRSYSTADTWDFLCRGIVLFNTSLTNFIIDSATLSLYGFAKADPLGIEPDIGLYSSNPSSNTALVGADINTIGSTAFSSEITYSAWATGAYNDFALNESGLATVRSSSIAKFGLKNSNYDNAAIAPTWSVSAESNLSCYAADQTGTANDPRLVVDYRLPFKLRPKLPLRPAVFSPGLAR